LRGNRGEVVVSGNAGSPGALEAAQYLAELLKGDLYRPLWDRPDYTARQRESKLHRTGIAAVLAQYLHSHPREGRPEDRDILPSQLVPLVSKVINGKSLGTETLRVFIEAFKIRREHADRLRRLHSGTNTVRLLPDASAVPLDTVNALPHGRHRTRFVLDHHYLGVSGLPYRHETFQVIEATAEGLDRYAYAFDTDALTVEVLTGGTLGQPYTVPNGVHAVDILFGRPVALGRWHVFQHETTFRYISQPSPEFRRAVTVNVEYANIKVTFHSRKLPKRVWEATWEDVASEPVKGDAVTLDDYRTAGRCLQVVENTVFGLVWEW
jgi:hypothetical protein